MKSYMKYISSKFTRQNKDIFVSDKIHAKCTMYHESKKFLGKMDLIPNQSTEKLRRDLVTCTQGRIQDFFEKGCTRLLLYFNTNKPHSFFFAEYQLYQKTASYLRGGAGGAHPLHPPPRSAPGTVGQGMATVSGRVSIICKLKPNYWQPCIIHLLHCSLRTQTTFYLGLTWSQNV